MRRGFVTGWALVFAVPLGLMMLGVPVAMARDDGFPVAMTVFAAFAGALGVAMIVRAASIRCIADDAGITIANMWRTHRLAWADVATIEIGLGSGAWQTGSTLRLALSARTRAGKLVIASATTTREDHMQRMALDFVRIEQLAKTHAVEWKWSLPSAELRAAVEALTQPIE